MGLWQRLFGSESEEITTLKARLDDSERAAKWFESRCEESGQARIKAENALRSETKRNRLREDELTNQLLEIAGGRRLPARTEPVQPIEPETPKGLNPAADQTLRQRAFEYCEQKFPESVDEHIEEVYKQMLAEPEHWLSD